MAEPKKATTEETPTYSGAYGTKNSMPMWAWILIYVVIGGIVYYAAYALYFAKKDQGYGAATNSSPTTPTGSLYDY